MEAQNKGTDKATLGTGKVISFLTSQPYKYIALNIYLIVSK